MDNRVENKQNYIQNLEKDLRAIEYRKIRKEIISNRKVKRNELYYNPIIQKYNDISLNSKTIQADRCNLLNSIIKNKDYKLQYEQAYNIINLEDKLKGFENHPNYPKPRNFIKTKRKIPQPPKEFNILSNLPVSIHHFDKPENRPKIPNKSESPKRKNLKNLSYYDYDIISTRYNQFNDEKNKIDKEINKINTARIFYKNNDYNIIKGAFYNKQKEEEYQKKKYEASLTWGQDKIKKLPKCARGKGDVYNLITTDVFDPVEMNRLIQEEKDKKQRYQIRYNIEKYYRNKNLENMSKDETKTFNKTSFQRYKIEDDRQYNIINLKEKPFQEHAKNIKNGYETAWETILNGSNRNNTFDKKQIYRHPNDYSDTAKYYNEFKIRRRNTLSKINRIESDPLFNTIKKFEKSRIRSLINRQQLNSQSNTTIKRDFMDKSKFFKTIS